MATTQPTDDATTQPTTDATTARATNTNTKTAPDPATTADISSIDLTDLPDLSTAPTVGQSTVSITNAPSLTATNSVFHLSDIPTIAGYGVPQQTVPWTAGAPFMQKSQLPEGTVFIIVGAVLGFLGMAVLVWRGLVAWSLHRSVKRAALGSHYNDSMMKMQPPQSAGMGSTLSLDRLSAPAGKLSRPRHSRHGSGGGGGSHGVSNTNAAKNSSLFFSPTAGAGAHHTSHSVSSNHRGSAYLPAGYYASPSAATPAQGNKHASIGGGGLAPASSGNAARLSSLNPNHPSNRGYTQTQSNNSDYNHSPPDSPGSMANTMRPSTGGTLPLPSSRRGYERVAGNGHAREDSWGGLNVPEGALPGQRAPSANLEELFAHHGGGMAK